jgi:hypothetical protein
MVDRPCVSHVPLVTTRGLGGGAKGGGGDEGGGGAKGGGGGGGTTRVPAHGHIRMRVPAWERQLLVVYQPRSGQ